MNSQSVLLQVLLASLMIAQSIALFTYQMNDVTLIDGLRDTLIRVTWALAAWLCIFGWHSLRALRPTFNLAPSPSSEREMVRAWLGRTRSALPQHRATPSEIRAAVLAIYGRPYEAMYDLSCVESSPEDLHALVEEWIVRHRDVMARGENVRLVWPTFLPSRGAAYDHEARRPRWMDA